MKIVLDITKLVKDGVLTPQLAEHLKTLAVRETGSLLINILLSLGSFAIAAGFVARKPSAEMAIAVGAALAGLGLYLKQRHQDQWGVLGSANVVVGALIVSGGLLVFWKGSFGAFLFVALMMLALGAAVRSGLLIALSPLAFASVLGSSTGYWHASYLLVVREAAITIAVFVLFAWGALYLSKRLSSEYENLALIFSRISLILVNFGFWVGSLWGNYPGESWVWSRNYQDYSTFKNSWEALKAWRESAFFIPDYVFAILWALGLAAVGAWGARRGRRFAVNTAAVFGAIHFYTQWFERLGATPGTVMFSGVVVVGLAIGLWKYNRLAAQHPAAAREPE